MQARSIGFYSKGCLAGGVGAADQRQDLAGDAAVAQSQLGPPEAGGVPRAPVANKAPRLGWPGLLVGDMSQPRGGPMLTGHASHQVGLDADIWLTPMPNREFTRRRARRNVGDHGGRARPQGRRSEGLDAGAHRGDQGGRRGAGGRAHLRQRGDQEGALPRGRRRPRLAATRCGRIGGTTIISMSASTAPADSPDCKPQTAVPAGDGCGKELDWWFTDAVLHPKPAPPPTRRRTQAPGHFGRPAAGLPAGAARAVAGALLLSGSY